MPWRIILKLPAESEVHSYVLLAEYIGTLFFIHLATIFLGKTSPRLPAGTRIQVILTCTPKFKRICLMFSHDRKTREVFPRKIIAEWMKNTLPPPPPQCTNVLCEKFQNNTSSRNSIYHCI